MAKFKEELPNDIIKQVNDLEKNVSKMIEEMTRAGAEVAFKNVKSNLPQSFYGSQILKNLVITKTYKTSDGSTATKIGVYGYFKNREGRETPAPLVANLFEYGSHSGRYPKKPFFRKSFKKKEIESAMEAVQNKYLPKG